MAVKAILATTKDGVIGVDGQLPWQNLKDDMKFFKEMTTGHTVIMGRKNFESIGKALPNRRNIVLTRNRDFKAEGCEVIWDTVQVLDDFDNKDEDFFIIGGAEIYKEFGNLVEEWFITAVDMLSPEGELTVYDPPFFLTNPKTSMEVVKEQKADDRNDHNFTIYKVTIGK